MAFSEDLKRRVKRRAHFSCCLCHALWVEVHHIVPVSDGGIDSEDNAAPLCPSCHEDYGANPQKRKFIREARDFWYEICENRYSSDPDRMDEISSMLRHAATKQDLDRAVDRIADFLRAIGSSRGMSTEDKAKEISQIGGSAASGIGFGRVCTKCGTSIGLLIGDEGRCPNCGSPW